MSNMSGATPMRVTLTITVAVDPVAFGFDLPMYEAEGIIVAAIDRTMGLEVAKSVSVVNS
ncbi:MAG: hypothetical protein JWQ81_8561 [Amycolatopsis sp.]|uniref:hypothetical protein n=1 Tax=Amycolatopsis sp. TaxID=37632 RepID=UPI00262CD3BE|nr:hypothetical protein [Amycolatopsis sp.]MCU1687822.1 hypothetical protein [Amycolatopsis sp.]